MTVQERIYTFTELGKDIQQLSEEERHKLALQAKANNPWFISESVQLALDTIIRYLHPELLIKWLSAYNLPDTKPKKVGVVMAGNTPAEGFHDYMCVLLSGHTLLAKLNVQDEVILKRTAGLLVDINPEFEEKIVFADRLHGIDALIATVNDKTVGQFHRYFSHIPNIIRSSAKSCAILHGAESTVELGKLGDDILHYFGLGNRSVSKLYVPEGYSFNSFFESIEHWNSITQHYKYVNNYDYNKSVLLVNQRPHLDNGFLLLYERDKLVSPVGVVHFEYYKDTEELAQKIQAHQHQLQNIVSQNGWYPESIAFGQTVKPGLSDYLSGVDTMQFLASL